MKAQHDAKKETTIEHSYLCRMKKPLFLIIYLFSFLLLPLFSYSQIKTEYYPNGNKQFEGNYVMAWSDVEPEDKVTDPQVPNNTESTFDDLEKTFFLFMNPYPKRKYEGECTFYYQNGKKWFQGKYQYGVKQGKFQYWYASGQLAMERYYINGMADGNWKTWDEGGQLSASYSYKVLPDSLLRKMHETAWKRKRESDIDQKEVRELLDKSRDITIRFFDTPNTFDGFSLTELSHLAKFKVYIKDHLYKRTIWDGPFKVWHEGQPLMEFEYTNNVRSGTWKLYEDGDLVFLVQFHNGTPKNPKDYSLPQKPSKDAAAEQTGSTTVPSVGENPDTRTKKEAIYRYVEVPPQFNGDLNQFFRTNTIYPKEAIKKNIQGRVFLSFVILKTGEIDRSSIKVERGLGYGIDEEAIRLIKFLPMWKPAKLNGEAVNMYYNLTINFSLQ